MHKKLLLFGAAACLAGPAAAQQTLPQSYDLSLLHQGPALAQQAPAMGARATAVCDDFNRANSTNLGADWSEMVGDVEVLGDLCSNVATTSWMLHTGAAVTHVGAKVEFDIGPNPGAGYANTAAIIGYNPGNGEAIYVKVQNQSGQPGYSHVGFYHAINSGGYNGWGGFQALPYQTPGGHVTVSVDAAGDLVTLEIDEDYDGNPEISMVAPGSLITSGLGALLGDQYGLGFWTAGNADNFEVNDGCVSGPALGMTGPCPGTKVLSMSGMTGGGIVAVTYGFAGSWTNQSQTCNGLMLDLVPIPSLPILLVADGSGNAAYTANAPGGCGNILVQAVDVATCVKTNYEIL